MNQLLELLKKQKEGIPAGIYSCCSASEFVLKAALLKAKAHRMPVLIEATANQVNQYGGYTGMTPEAFMAFLRKLVRETELPEDQLIVGGDHLGPLTWADEPEAEAMEKAQALVYQFAKAGFTKIHLDTSMRLKGDPKILPDETIARRGAELCRWAERGYQDRLKEFPFSEAPVYIIGSEVPIPGGAQEVGDMVSVTKPEACIKTFSAFKEAFERNDLTDAWNRVIALVVQPGVEFSDCDVTAYDHEKALPLTRTLKELPVVFEGHSTDYQTPAALRSMVQDGIAILKVGPALTFALREALYALENMEKERFAGTGLLLSNFRATLDEAMLENPNSWAKHYHGSPDEIKFARAFSLSDRARYSLPDERVRRSVDQLLSNLSDGKTPWALISQYMPMQYPKVRSGELKNLPENLIYDRIGNCIDDYLYAVKG